MSKKRSWIRAGVLVSVLGLIAGACSTSTKKDTAAPAGDQRIERVRMVGGQMGYPTPYAYSKGPGLAMTDLAFDTLLWKDASGKMIPWLATSWQMSPDGKEWRFTLREGVKWQDGQPLTAEDVVFTYEYDTTGPGKSALGVIGQIPVTGTAIEAPNVVVLKLATPYAPFEDTVAGRVPIIPKHIWQNVTDPAKFRDPTALIGSGPYRVAAWDDVAGSYAYDADDSWWGGPPKVKRVEFVASGNDLLSLQRGEVDVASPSGIVEQALAPFENNDRYGILTAPGESTTALHFNLTKGFPYDNKQFRQAMATSLDRPDMVKRLLLGRGEVANTGNVANSHPMVAPNLPTYSLDVTKARSMLDALGIKDVTGDGMRELPDGQAFQPELFVATGTVKTGELMKEYLRAVGIDLQIKSVDQATHDQSVAGGNYTMALVGYGGLGGDPDWLRQRLSSKIQSRTFLRVQGFNNPRFEELAAAQLVTTDVAQRTQMIQEMQRIVADELPVLALTLATRTTVYDKTVFDAWYYTPGAVFGLVPGLINKHVFVTGKQVGF
jgi:peptide/nickel transport system substrate-binding protein